MRLPTHTERMAWNLSQVTPHPYFLYENRIPSSLVEKISRALKKHKGKGNLPSLGDDSIVSNRSKLERTCAIGIVEEYIHLLAESIVCGLGRNCCLC